MASKRKKLPTKKHYVEFYSPGTFFDETTSKEVEVWDTNEAVEMAKTITERYGAKPFGFRFVTEELKANKDGSKTWQVTKEDPKFYYIGGTVLTLAEIKARKNPKDDILISNMEGNGWNKVIQNDNSYRTVRPYDSKRDVILKVKL